MSRCAPCWPFWPTITKCSPKAWRWWRGSTRPLRGGVEEVPMHHPILPIPRKPYALGWLPERLIVSHCENDYEAAVRSLNTVRDRLAFLDLAVTPGAEIRALKREELLAMLQTLDEGGDT